MIQRDGFSCQHVEMMQQYIGKWQCTGCGATFSDGEVSAMTQLHKIRALLEQNQKKLDELQARVDKLSAYTLIPPG